MYIACLLSLVLLTCIYLFLKRNYNYWKRKGVPNPPASVIFGNLGESLTFTKSLGQIYHEIYQKYTDLAYVGFYKMRTPGVILRDPELVREVLVKSFNHFQANDLKIDDANDPLVAKNPFFVHGEKWKNNRSILSPSFTSKQVKPLFPLMEEVCHKLVKYLETKENEKSGIEAKELAQRFTMDVVASCAVGLEADSFKHENTEFRTMAERILSPSFFTNIKLFFLFAMPSLALFLKLKFVPDDAADYFRKIVNQTMNYRKENGIIRHDFLNNMQNVKLSLGEENFTNEDITIHLVGFFMDGFETSSVVLSHALYEIAANPHHQKKLREEIEQSLTERGKFDYYTLRDLDFLNRFLQESLRMHPADMFIAKLCTEEFEFPSPTGSGPNIKIEPKTPVIIPIHSLHYDPQYYPDPEKFDPDRFTKENKEKIVKGTYLPFSDGPRICLGQKFALGQIRAAIAHIVTNFEIRVNSRTIQPLQIDPTSSLVAAKGGIWLDFYKRHRN
uniref:Cytochrome P450 n=1 Tax=Photinus pyralis TaxID=7054 RepID=A0A1Y1JWW3_PHOPY